jgi:integrase/recombinase XerD
MRVHCAKPVFGLSAIRSRTFQQRFHEYERWLVRAGYHPAVARRHLHSIAHFGVWMERQGHRLDTIDDQTLEAFERHRPTCRCPGTSRNRARQVRSCVRRFLRYLREQGVVPVEEVRPRPGRWVQGFLRWMHVDRGVGESTRVSYGRHVGDLIHFLGDDPQAYTAGGLRKFVTQRCRHYRRNSSRMVLAAVRMFLRYLAGEGQCRPGLEHALTPLANWSSPALPRGLTPEQVRHVLAMCPATARGRRDRAVLLLLIRLGLRAGDVATLRCSDLDFELATIRVLGKGGREARLPLPQDVGDALLAYLRDGRPRVPSAFVFLRSMAPFVPFATRAAGHAVGHIARAALKRAGVTSPTRGAHVFRHTAACQMLRAGVGLEGIADVLRHRSVQTTSIYATVDVELLRSVAQPWPVAEPC